MEFLVLSIVIHLLCIKLNIVKLDKELESLNKKIEELTDAVWRSRDE